MIKKIEQEFKNEQEITYNNTMDNLNTNKSKN